MANIRGGLFHKVLKWFVCVHDLLLRKLNKCEKIAMLSLKLVNVLFKGPLLSHCTLRLLKPKCALDQNWSEEPLEKQVERITNWIFAATQPKNKQLFHAPTFNFFFFFLQSVLQQKILPQGDLLNCLTIMSCHVKVNPDDLSLEVMFFLFCICVLHFINVFIATGQSLTPSSWRSH